MIFFLINDPYAYDDMIFIPIIRFWPALVIADPHTVSPGASVIGFIMDSAASNCEPCKGMHDESEQQVHSAESIVSLLPPLILLQHASNTFLATSRYS
jgi:hypothetical protein